MKAYRKIQNKKPEGEIKEDEIRIMAGSRGNSRGYINYALKKLGHLPPESKKDGEGEAEAEGKEQPGEAEAEGKEQPEETPLRAVTFRAMGQAINTTVDVVEFVKRTIPGLHQINEINSSEITDVYEPIYEGLRTVKVTRRVARIEITLSKDQPADTSHVGYQPPKTAEEILAEEKMIKEAKEAVRESKKSRRKKRRSRRNSRRRSRRNSRRRSRRNSKRRNQQNDAPEQSNEEEQLNPEEGAEDGKQRGRGRGRRGRGQRRRSRGRRKGRGRGRGPAAGEGKQSPADEGTADPDEGKTASPAEGEAGGRGGRGGGRRGRGRGKRKGRRVRGRGRGRGRGGGRNGAPPRFSEDEVAAIPNLD